MKTTSSKATFLFVLTIALPSCGMPGGGEWIWIAGIALLLFGGAKLPGLMRGLGQGVNELKKGLKEGAPEDEPKSDDDDDDDSSTDKALSKKPSED